MAVFESPLSQTDLFGGKCDSLFSTSFATASAEQAAVQTKPSTASDGQMFFGTPTAHTTATNNTGLFDTGLSKTQPRQQRPRQARCVRFHPASKQNDGLRPSTDMFNEYMKDVFKQTKRPNGETTLSVLARNRNVVGLFRLREMLVNLINRCRRSPSGRAVILSQGGGNAGSITIQHLPYLYTHVKYLETVIRRVRSRIATIQQQAAHMSTNM